MTPKSPLSIVSDEALFRFAVVSDVLARIARGQVRAEAIREAAKHPHYNHRGIPKKAGLRSIYRWLAAYERDGFLGLETKRRTQHTDGVLEPALVEFLVEQKQEDPRASIPQLLRLAVSMGLLASAEEVDRTTVWRALKRRHVITRIESPKVKDQRRFEYPHRLQMVLCDGKQFRVGPKGLKRVALFFIDDATRYIPLVVVGFTETAALFLRGVHRLLQLVGKIDGFYVDQGSGFIARDSGTVIGSLEIAHLIGTKRYPQARGKIERFNQTVQEDLLRHFGREDIDPNCLALELRIAHYLRTDYNVRPHSALPKGETPQSRFLSDERVLTPYTDGNALRRYFFTTVERTVTNDHIISIDGLQWEVPRGLAKQRIVVHRDVFDPLHILLDHEGKELRLQQVDLVANARAHRGESSKKAPETSPTTQGAALKNAEDALAPITDVDGGYADTNEEE